MTRDDFPAWTIWERTHRTGTEYIRVSLCNGIPEVTTNLLETDEDSEHTPLWNAAINALTSHILAQCFAGMDVRNPAYREALLTTLDTLADQFGDD